MSDPTLPRTPHTDAPAVANPQREAAWDAWRQDVSWTVSQDANHRLVYEAFCAGWGAGRAAAPDDEDEQVIRLMAVAAEAHRDGYENGRADEREACAPLAEQQRLTVRKRRPRP